LLPVLFIDSSKDLEAKVFFKNFCFRKVKEKPVKLTFKKRN